MSFRFGVKTVANLDLKLNVNLERTMVGNVQHVEINVELVKDI